MATIQLQQQEVINKVQSLALVKNMFRASISTICYSRDVFPAECFTEKTYCDLTVHSLDVASRESKDLVIKNKEAFLLTQWLERGVFDALEKRYLRELQVCVVTAENGDEKTIESWKFTVAYPDSEDISINGNNATKDSLKREAIRLIRNIIDFSGTLAPLPTDHYLTMKILYFDDVVPPNYEPNYFRSDSVYSIPFVKEPMRIKLGNVSSDHHLMQVKYQGIESLFQDVPDVIEPSTSIISPQQEQSQLQHNSIDSNTHANAEVVSSSTKKPTRSAGNVREDLYEKVKSYIINTRPAINISSLSKQFHLTTNTIKMILDQLVSEKVLTRSLMRKRNVYELNVDVETESIVSSVDDDDDEVTVLKRKAENCVPQTQLDEEDVVSRHVVNDDDDDETALSVSPPPPAIKSTSSKRSRLENRVNQLGCQVSYSQESTSMVTRMTTTTKLHGDSAKCSAVINPIHRL